MPTLTLSFLPQCRYFRLISLELKTEINLWTRWDQDTQIRLIASLLLSGKRHRSVHEERPVSLPGVPKQGPRLCLQEVRNFLPVAR